jgi:hypothetical protein
MNREVHVRAGFGMGICKPSAALISVIESGLSDGDVVVTDGPA